MKFKETLGIDVSKKTIDVSFHLISAVHKFDNSVKGFKALLRWVKKQSGLNQDQILICFEHTGLYSLPLAVFLTEKKIAYWIESGLKIKRSLGLARGKNDIVDAKRIAEYAYMRRDQLKPFELPSINVLKLQKLLSLRERMVKQRAGYSASKTECKSFLKQKDYEPLFSKLNKMIHYLGKQIDAIEKEIKTLIDSDQKMKVLYRLIISVKGVGLVLASNLLVSTNCFTAFKNSRKFACYAGIAPFGNQSGTTLNTKPRVSHFANKRLKSLLYLSAISAIQADPELKAYYQKRVEMGKSKMSTLNIIKNKIVNRIFAVVSRGTPFVPLFQHAA